MLATRPAPHNSITLAPRTNQIPPQAWLRYYDPQAAVQSVVAYVTTLYSNRTKARETMTAYLASLRQFAQYLGAWVDYDRTAARVEDRYTFDFSAAVFPDPQVITGFMAHCANQGMAVSTIQRHMAAVRHFLRAIIAQGSIPQSSEDFFYLTELRRQLDIALSIKSPSTVNEGIAPLHAHGQRLRQLDVNKLFESFDNEIHRLAGQRDFLLLYIGITTGLRASELARITLNSLHQRPDTWVVQVLGKRGKRTPVPLDDTAVQGLQALAHNWNLRLADDDPRRIGPDTPVFQPIMHNDAIPPLGYHGYDPARGLSRRSILDVVAKRTGAALGRAIAAHDMRRTAAALAQSSGMPLEFIQRMLRHDSPETTQIYIGELENLSPAKLTNRIQFHIPRDLRQPLEIN